MRSEWCQCWTRVPIGSGSECVKSYLAPTDTALESFLDRRTSDICITIQNRERIRRKESKTCSTRDDLVINRLYKHKYLHSSHKRAFLNSFVVFLFMIILCCCFCFVHDWYIAGEKDLSFLESILADADFLVWLHDLMSMTHLFTLPSPSRFFPHLNIHLFEF